MGAPEEDLHEAKCPPSTPEMARTHVEEGLRGLFQN